MRLFLVLSCAAFLFGCGGGDAPSSLLTEATDNGLEEQVVVVDSEIDTSTSSAAVTDVRINGDENAYTFSVTVRSPDIGCSQYADWWEVIRPDGTLLYRRVLTHSHVDEQPFTRSGGPIDLTFDEAVIVRVHMNNLGYGEQVFEGSVSTGFISTSLDTSFAQTLEFSEPLPTGCAF